MSDRQSEKSFEPEISDHIHTDRGETRDQPRQTLHRSATNAFSPEKTDGVATAKKTDMEPLELAEFARDQPDIMDLDVDELKKYQIKSPRADPADPNFTSVRSNLMSPSKSVNLGGN